MQNTSKTMLASIPIVAMVDALLNGYALKVWNHTIAGVMAQPCASQPTREVKALAVNGWSSRALLYASQPGTAPPRTIRAGSRNNGLLTDASLVRKAGPAMEVVGRKTPDFVTDGFGVTPKALTAKVEETKRRLRSFMVMFY